MLHNLTHTPFRAWCKWCLQGRGRDDPHRTGANTEHVIPIIFLDYLFLKVIQPENNMETVIVMVDHIAKAVAARTVTEKGAVVATVQALVHTLANWGKETDYTLF